MDGIAYAIRGGKRMNRIQFRAWYPERQKMYVVAKADKGEPSRRRKCGNLQKLKIVGD